MKKSKYVKKGPKDYKKWIDEHKDEIINIESKKRTDYVYEHMNHDLNINKSKYEIYQLLYRNKMIERKTKNNSPVTSVCATYDNKIQIKSEESSPINNNNNINNNLNLNHEPINNEPITISEITNYVINLTKSDYNPEFLQSIVKRYIELMNKLNDDLEQLNIFKKEIKNMF